MLCHQFYCRFETLTARSTANLVVTRPTASHIQLLEYDNCKRNNTPRSSRIVKRGIRANWAHTTGPLADMGAQFYTDVDTKHPPWRDLVLGMPCDADQSICPAPHCCRAPNRAVMMLTPLRVMLSMVPCAGQKKSAQAIRPKRLIFFKNSGGASGTRTPDLRIM